MLCDAMRVRLDALAASAMCILFNPLSAALLTHPTHTHTQITHRSS
jgi:hypothetical protein